ncbi:hypothetical protein AB0B31_10765 [Catellatospora citrea]|uniref:hypothetical protein n=1 Tax=Catellatospora citrea TaxID=53366 RepID=UPI003409ACFC
MTSYTVQITPDDPAKPTITIRLDLEADSTVLRELSLKTSGEHPLSAGRLPVLDLNHIVSAVTAAMTPTGPAAAPILPTMAADMTAADTMPSAPVRAAAGRRGRASADTSAQSTTASDGQSKTEGASPNAVPASPPKAAAVRRKATSGKAGTRHATPGAASGRTYRRLPDDFAQVIRQTGDSAAAIADYYQVPRHTAYSWIRTHGKQATASTPS